MMALKIEVAVAIAVFLFSVIGIIRFIVRGIRHYYGSKASSMTKVQ